ncbi:sporulation protein RMD1 [Pseudoscourfieldia marina]
MSSLDTPLLSGSNNNNNVSTGGGGGGVTITSSSSSTAIPSAALIPLPARRALTQKGVAGALGGQGLNAASAHHSAADTRRRRDAASAATAAAVARPPKRPVPVGVSPPTTSEQGRENEELVMAEHVMAFCLSAGFSEQLPSLLEQKFGRRVTWNAHREALYMPFASTHQPPTPTNVPARATPQSVGKAPRVRDAVNETAAAAATTSERNNRTLPPRSPSRTNSKESFVAEGLRSIRVDGDNATTPLVVGTPGADADEHHEPMMYYTRNVDGTEDPTAAEAAANARQAALEAMNEMNEMNGEEEEEFDAPAFSFARNPDAVGSFVPAAVDERAIIFFEFGVVLFWGVTRDEAANYLQEIVEPCALDPFHARFVETDELVVRYNKEDKDEDAGSTVAGSATAAEGSEEDGDAASEAPVCELKDDVVLLSLNLRGDTATRMAIGYALAQSTRLSVFEEQLWETATRLRMLPVELNLTGHVQMSRRELSKFIGSLYVQRSSLAMLRHSLDKPEYFWSASDVVSRLYTDVAAYLEMDNRLEALNRRMDVVNDTLTMLRDQQNHWHGERLEWIVILLILIEVVVGVIQLLSSFGYLGGKGGG